MEVPITAHCCGLALCDERKHMFYLYLSIRPGELVVKRELKILSRFSVWFYFPKILVCICAASGNYLYRVENQYAILEMFSSWVYCLSDTAPYDFGFFKMIVCVISTDFISEIFYPRYQIPEGCNTQSSGAGHQWDGRICPCTEDTCCLCPTTMLFWSTLSCIVSALAFLQRLVFSQNAFILQGTPWLLGALLKAYRVELRSSKIIRLCICYACIPNSELYSLFGQSQREIVLMLK